MNKTGNSTFSIKPSSRLADQYSVDVEISNEQNMFSDIISNKTITRQKSKRKGFGIQQLDSAQMDFI